MNDNVVLDSITQLTHDVLEEVQTEPNRSPLVCFGLSDVALNEIFYSTYSIPGIEKEVQQTPNTSVIFHFGRGNIKINSESEMLQINTQFSVRFVVPDTSGYIAVVTGDIAIDAQINLVTSLDSNDSIADQAVQIQVNAVRISNNITTKNNPQKIKSEFGDDDIFINFEQFVSRYISEIQLPNNLESEFGGVVSLAVSALTIPEPWLTTENYILSSGHILYKTGRVDNKTSGIIFFVFLVTGLNVPPPCICREKLLKSSTQPPNDQAFDNQLILPTVFTIGFNQEALNEILKPIIETAAIIHHDYSGPRISDITTSANYSIEGRLNQITISENPDSINIPFRYIDAKGSIRAKLKISVKGYTILSTKASVGLKLELNNLDISLEFKQMEESGPRGSNTFMLDPSVTIGNIEFYYESNVSNQILVEIKDPFLSALATAAKDVIANKIRDEIMRGGIKLIRAKDSVDSNRDFDFLYNGQDFKGDKSAVLALSIEIWD